VPLTSKPAFTCTKLVALSSFKSPVVVLIVLSSTTPIVMLPKLAPVAVMSPANVPVPSTAKLLLIVVVPVLAPMLTVVAAPPKLMVVAFVGKILPVVAVVRMLPLKTYKSPRTTTLPLLSGIGGHITAAYTSGTEVTLGSDATDTYVPGTIVARDASGNFAANVITASNISARVGGSAPAGGLNLYSNNIGVGVGNALHLYDDLFQLVAGTQNWYLGSDGRTFFPNYTFPAADGTANQVLTTNGSGVVTWALPGGGGSTFGNVSIGVDTDQTISTTSGDLILQTAAGVNSGTITINAGVAGNIVLAPNTTGDVHLNADNVRIGDANATATLATRGTGNLVLTTNEGSAVEGTLTFANGANGSATFAPNGTGNVATTFNNGGNLTNNRNYVFGAIRNATTQSIGDIWALNSTGTVQPFRGVSLDNSADTTKNAGYLARNYASTAGGRSRLIFERARGTAASPAAVQSGDFLGEVDVTGYTSTGWLSDNIITGGGVPGFFGFTAAENWVSNTALGTNFGLSLAPTSTTITSAANLVPVLALTPQASTYRADTHTFQAGKSGTYGFLDMNGLRVLFNVPIKFPAFLATAVNGTLATTGASGTGSVATLTFGALASAPFTVGSQVIVAG